MALKFNIFTGKFDYVSSAASEISVVDVGAYYAGTNVETVLQEVGNTLTTTLAATYVLKAGDTMTGNLNLSTAGHTYLSLTSSASVGGISINGLAIKDKTSGITSILLGRDDTLTANGLSVRHGVADYISLVGIINSADEWMSNFSTSYGIVLGNPTTPGTDTASGKAIGVVYGTTERARMDGLTGSIRSGDAIGANAITIAGAASLSPVSVTATGVDTNVGINITPKGAGKTTFSTTTLAASGATTAPSYAFTSSTNSGIRLLGASAVAIVSGGVDIAYFASATGLLLNKPLYYNLSPFIVYDENTNEILRFVTTATAVNELTITNAATATNPTLFATGGDTNVGINITPKGTGIVTSTGNVYITKTAPEYRLTDGDYSRLTRVTASNKLNLYNRVSTPASGSPFLFSGDDALRYFTLPNNALLQPTAAITIECWIYPTNAAGAIESIITQDYVALTNKGYVLAIASGTLIWRGGNGAAYFNKTTAVANNTWYYIVGTWSAADGARLYVNGVEIGTSAALAGPLSYTAQSAKIGSWNYSGTDYNFSGSIDEVVIWSKVLSQAEITTNYAAGAGLYGSAAANLVGGYHLDEGTGTSAADFSGNLLTATGTSNLWAASIKAVPVATVVETSIINSQDGVAGAEQGIHTFGTALGQSILQGSNVWLKDSNGNELFKTAHVTSAVNELTITNAATGTNPTLSATGGDTNIGINITPKGTGDLSLTSGVFIVPVHNRPTDIVIGNNTFIITAKAQSYFFTADQTTTNVSTSQTYNITGVANTPGVPLYISVRGIKSASAGSVSVSITLQINGVTIFTITPRDTINAKTYDAGGVYFYDPVSATWVANNGKRTFPEGAAYALPVNFTGNLSTGMYANNNNLWLVANGVEGVGVESTGISLPGNGKITEYGGGKTMLSLNGVGTGTVNNFKISNASTGGNPILEAIGGDANIGINLTTKGTGVVTVSANALVAPYFQTSTAITANSTGTVAIVAKDAGVATANAGWMPFKKSDGTTVYIPYWA